jgi:hypothetical protein
MHQTNNGASDLDSIAAEIACIPSPVRLASLNPKVLQGTVFMLIAVSLFI